MRDLVGLETFLSAPMGSSCSDSKREATTGKALLRTGVLVNLAWLESSLCLALHGFASLLLVVLSLHLLKLTSQALDLILVLVDLGLVHVELSSHRLHLVGLLLQVLLVDGQLLSNFRARLASKQVLQLYVELLFFLDADILLHHLLGLLDQSLLQRLDLV